LPYLVILTADPLDDIGNIRKVAAVWKDGRAVDREHLPRTRVLSAAPRGSGGSGGPAN